MTEAIAFDAHRFVKNLTAGGFTERQAETLAEEYARLFDGNLATGTGIERVGRPNLGTFGADLRADIRTFGAEVKVELQRFKADVLKWMLTGMLVQSAVIAWLIVGLNRFS